jgi:hypothetical protein
MEQSRASWPDAAQMPCRLPLTLTSRASSLTLSYGSITKLLQHCTASHWLLPCNLGLSYSVNRAPPTSNPLRYSPHEETPEDALNFLPPHIKSVPAHWSGCWSLITGIRPSEHIISPSKDLRPFEIDYSTCVDRPRSHANQRNAKVLTSLRPCRQGRS